MFNNMESSVTVIGAANMDINGFSRDPVKMADSNPGKVEYCPGGVGRNIAENLFRLGVPVRLISVIGDDPAGKMIYSSSRNMGLDIEHSLLLSGEISPVYMAIMDSNGEMKLALSDMSILEKMSREHLESKAELISGSGIVVMDANLSEEILAFILGRFGGGEVSPGSGPGKKPLFFLDPVSEKKSARTKNLVHKFDTLKLNRMEAEFLSGISIVPEAPLDGLKKAGDYFINGGTRRVFITLGKAGIYCATAEKAFFTPGRYVKPVNTSGGGDAFMAGMVYGTLRGWEDEYIVQFAAAMGSITVQSDTTVSPKMSPELVQQTIKSYN
jgi:pseudouridine kinase